MFASPQDSYIPMESALANSRIGEASILCRNLMQGLSSRTLTRFSISFSAEEASIDAWLGRAAHIGFLKDLRITKLIAQQLQTA